MTKIHLLFAPLGVVFLALNVLGDVISGIWLAAIGQWWAIGIGIIGLFSSHFAISILLTPGTLIALPAAALEQKRRLGLAKLFAGLSSLYTSALIAAWGAGVLLFFGTRAAPNSAVPLLIWSYGVATGPWGFLASKDQQAGGNEYSAMATFFLQVGYVVAAVVLLAGGTFGVAIASIAAAMGVNWLLQMIVLRDQLRVETLMQGPLRSERETSACRLTRAWSWRARPVDNELSSRVGQRPTLPLAKIPRATRTPPWQRGVG